MKRYICIFFSTVIACCFLIGCSGNYPYYDMPIENTRSSDSGMKYFTIETLADLEEHSPYVVRGKVEIGDRKIKTATRDIGWGKVQNIYFTQSTLTITDVFQGSLKIGDKIPLAEPWYIDVNEEGEKVLYTKDGYMPPDPNKEYIFFLEHHSGEFLRLDGNYVPITSTTSRYPIPDLQMTYWGSQKDLYFLEPTDSFYNIYEEIQEKYLS